MRSYLNSNKAIKKDLKQEQLPHQKSPKNLKILYNELPKYAKHRSKENRTDQLYGSESLIRQKTNFQAGVREEFQSDKLSSSHLEFFFGVRRSIHTPKTFITLSMAAQKNPKKPVMQNCFSSGIIPSLKNRSLP